MAKVIVEIELDDDQLKKGFKNAQTASKKTGKKISKNLGKNITGGLTKSLKRLTGTIAAVGVAYLAAFGGRRILQLAQQQEDAIQKLNTALQLSGKFSEEASKGMQDFASEMQGATKFGDELILETAALIQSLGQLETDALKGATRAAADLSAALGVDLKAAALLVGKAAAGEVASFSRYGLIIKKGATNAETFATALQSINDKFGGAAAAQVNTFSGASEQLSNAFGDILEGIGGIITKSPVVINIFKKLTQEFLGVSKSVSKISIDPKTIQEGIGSFLSLAKAVTIIFGGLFEFIVNGFNTVTETITLLVSSVLAGAFRVASGLTGLAGRFSDKFKQMSDEFAITAEGFQGVAKESAEATKEAFTNIFDFETTEAIVAGIDVVRDSVLDANITMTDSFKNLNLEKDKLNNKDPLSEFAKRASAGAKQIDAVVKGGLVKSIQTASLAIGQSLAGAAGGFKGFTANLLGLIGDLAIQMGVIMLAMGLSIESLRTAIATLNPILAVAAGIALIALGGALKATSESIGGGGAAAPDFGSVGGGGVGGGSLEAGGGFDSEELERDDPQTTVSLTVNGSILDRRESGLELVEILNESFSNTGSTLVQGNA